jgi:hypothetical protein
LIGLAQSTAAKIGRLVEQELADKGVAAAVYDLE